VHRARVVGLRGEPRQRRDHAALSAADVAAAAASAASAAASLAAVQAVVASVNLPDPPRS